MDVLADNIKEYKIPILFLIFNRLDTTKEVFGQIKKIRPSKLYIGCDGPRKNNPSEEEKVLKIRTWVLENVTWSCEVKTLFRDHNVGCGEAVSSAISWFFNNEEMGVILEDDCKPDLSFFSYCEELLIRYRDDNRIMHIAGTNLFQHELTDRGDSYHFSKYANVWGWATWRRAWLKYDFNISAFSEVRETSILKDYFSYYPAYISRMKWYSAVFQNKEEIRSLNTWDYQWCFTCVRNASLSIVPKVNLIKNIGFDGRGTHTNIAGDFYSQEFKSIRLPLKHPKFIVLNEGEDKIYEQKIFGSPLSTYKMLVIDLIRKYFLKRELHYLKYIFRG